MLELGEDLLDRIEIGAIGRQEEQMGSLCADDIASSLAFVAPEIVEDDDVPLGQGRSQLLLDIEREEFGINRVVDDQGAQIRSQRSAVMDVIGF